jgi:hypothetical protein
MTDAELEKLKEQSSGDYTIDGDEESKEEAIENKENKEEPKEIDDGHEETEEEKPKKKKVKAGKLYKYVNKTAKKTVDTAGNTVGNLVSPGKLPEYTEPNFNIGKSGYKQSSYKSPYRPYKGAADHSPFTYQPIGTSSYYKSKPYEPIFKAPKKKVTKRKPRSNTQRIVGW